MTTRVISAPARVRSLEDILERVGRVPARQGFPGVDEIDRMFGELAAANPDLVDVSRIGTSSLGHPLLSYRVGHGARSHLIVGGVHPNEPIGFWTALHLATELCEDDGLRNGLDATWHIVPCIDPDGTRLNEAWFADPGDRVSYARSFYRPAPDEQVEWSFPTNYKRAYFDRMLPETQALARVIDLTRPDLYVSLHNGELGGVYYYLTRPEESLFSALRAIPEALGLSLDLGEPESPHLAVYSPAIFGTGTTADVYDYYESLGLDPVALIGGSSSSEYAERHGALGIVAELPYWSHPAASDATDSTERYSDLVRGTALAMRQLGSTLGEVLGAFEAMATLDSPFLRATRAFVPMFGRLADIDDARAQHPESERMATVAEVFSSNDLVRCFRLRYGGMLLRAIEAETLTGIGSDSAHTLAARMREIYSVWQEEARDDGSDVIAVEKLVGVQYGAVLAGAALIAERADRSSPDGSS